MSLFDSEQRHSQKCKKPSSTIVELGFYAQVIPPGFEEKL
jgi:hypothetical protein